jgi:cell division protein FtsW
MKGLIKIFIVIVVVLMLLGSIMVFTASGTYSFNKFNSLYYLFKSHLWKVFAAAFCFWLFAHIPYENYRKHSKFLLFTTIGVLILTFLVAPKVKGAARWIDFGFFQFQPSEVAKVVLIIHLAFMIERFGDDIADFKNGFLFALIWIGLVSGLVLIQPNVSTSMIIAFTSFAVLYVGGARLKHVFFTLWTVGSALGGIVMLLNHSRQRVLDFVNSLVTGNAINKQVLQAQIALGSGGIFGIGIGHSRQSDLFLPEAYGDFIFSIVGEELGFLGSIILLFLYMSLFLISLVIAKKSQDKFGQLIVFGLAFNILMSAFINSAVVTGLLPTTGITLPFVSFGGTSIILFGISAGIIVNVARETIKTNDLKIAQT